MVSGPRFLAGKGDPMSCHWSSLGVSMACLGWREGYQCSGQDGVTPVTGSRSIPRVLQSQLLSQDKINIFREL